MAKGILENLVINEISLVDTPAQEGARVTLMKRAKPAGDTPPATSEFRKYGELADVLTSETDGHQHGINVYSWKASDGKLKLEYSISYGMAPEDETTHNHPLARGSDGTGYVLGTVAGHTHTVDSAALGTAAMNLVMKGEKPVDPAEKNKNTEKLADLQKRLERAEAVNVLKRDARDHFDELAKDAQDAFLAKSSDDRASEIEAAQKAKLDSDPVVYTTMDGVELRKSAGELAITQAKALDTVRKENITLKAEREQERLEKRADAMLKHLPGTTQDRAALLKAAESIEDDDQRTVAVNALKASDEAMAGAWQTRGVPGERDESSPEGGLVKMAKQYAEEHDITYEQAYVKVMRTPKGRELLKKMPAAQAQQS